MKAQALQIAERIRQRTRQRDSGDESTTPASARQWGSVAEEYGDHDFGAVAVITGRQTALLRQTVRRNRTCQRRDRERKRNMSIPSRQPSGPRSGYGDALRIVVTQMYTSRFSPLTTTA